jgi:hypothetical protein
MSHHFNDASDSENDSGSKSCLDRRHYDVVVHIGGKSTANAGEI